MITMRRSTQIALNFPPDDAMILFTPEGERRWAVGWDPLYPDPDHRDGAGAVFTTAHGGQKTTWIVVDRGPETIRYARVVPGMSAGTIAIKLVHADERTTAVEVTHAVTALSAAGESWLEAFAAGYDAEIESWGAEIAEALDRPV